MYFTSSITVKITNSLKLPNLNRYIENFIAKNSAEAVHETTIIVNNQLI